MRTLGICLSFLLASTALAHDEPLVIGRDPDAPDHLAFSGPADLLSGAESIPLLPGDAAFEGLWVHDEPSFRTILADEPGMLRLLAGHAVALRLVSADEPLRFFEPVGFTQILTTPGSAFVFPTDPEGDFEIHLLGAATLPGVHVATFQFTDASGTHLDSGTFTLRFEAVPSPTSATPILIAALASRRRRTRTTSRPTDTP